MSTVLKVENVSKMYRLGTVGTGTLSHDLNRLWARVRGLPDPTLKIGTANDRTQLGGGKHVWALKDINLEVEKGEIIGIIGRNGAGKSTLLKLLSRVTAPTTGSIKARGRIASLLEVGTGFHPELTGRENVYLNGAIMGMTRPEIKKRLDEIVDFSGCAKYIDTPVKRYSSGMTVRLGFAVAAHLECEILIVDEVLSVGDFEFQKKCIGKMRELGKGGSKTILFVSHVMESVRSLCTRGVLMKNGTAALTGEVDSIVRNYLVDQTNLIQQCVFPIKVSDCLDLTRIEFGSCEIESGQALAIEVAVQGTSAGTLFEAALIFKSETGRRVAVVDLRNETFPIGLDSSKCYQWLAKIHSLSLVEGTYVMDFYLGTESVRKNIENVATFQVIERPWHYEFAQFPKSQRGCVNLPVDVSVTNN